MYHRLRQRHLPRRYRRAVMVLVLMALLGGLSAVSSRAAEDPDLPVIRVAIVDTLHVDTRGIRGMAVTPAGVWLLTSTHTGRQVPEGSYRSQIVSFNSSTGETSRLVGESNSYHTGLCYDGEFLWVGGNPIGGFEAIYRIDPSTGVAGESVPSSGYHAGGLAWAQEYLWQVDSSARQISRIEIEDGKLSRRLQTPGYYPTGLAHDGVSLYVADAATGMIYRMRARSGRANAILDPDVLRFAGEFVTLAWSGRYLWIARDSDDFIVRVELLR